ncbi:MAG TPA: nucleoside-diphosphate kinase [bacterium]|nr:nucleoside-diphosphate kinase [bacterium]HOL46851.1 nucleoside-diphosphate kinase [bacterium]HPQ18800.1 nucleoside-diphosphate kinase [bacterium]
MKEKTLAIIKPDAIQKNLVGKIIDRILLSGLKIIGLKMIQPTESEIREFYGEHKGQPYYEPLIKFMMTTPIIVIVLEGENAIKKWRQMMGKTNSPDAQVGTIRNEWGTNNRLNCVHGSDSEKSAAREIKFFFKEKNGFYE